MPVWAQWISECLPLTHYLRMVRGILLKAATFADLQTDILVLAGLMLLSMAWPSRASARPWTERRTLARAPLRQPRRGQRGAP